MPARAQAQEKLSHTAMPLSPRWDTRWGKETGCQILAGETRQRLSEMSDYIRNEGDTECVRLLALEYFV